MHDWQIFVLVTGGALAGFLSWMAWTYDDMFDGGGEP